MSQSTRRRSKDPSEDEPLLDEDEPSDAHNRSSTVGDEIPLGPVSSEYSEVSQPYGGTGAKIAASPRSRRRGSKDLPEEDSVEVPLPKDPATSSSPPKLSRRRSKDLPEEDVLPEVMHTASSSSGKVARRRSSKDPPEETSELPPEESDSFATRHERVEYSSSSLPPMPPLFPGEEDLHRTTDLNLWADQIIAEEDEMQEKIEASKVVVDIPAGELGMAFRGDIVSGLKTNGLARQIGVKVGWRIIAVDNQRCESFRDSVFLDARRNGSCQVTFVTLDEALNQEELTVDDDDSLRKAGDAEFDSPLALMDVDRMDPERSTSPFTETLEDEEQIRSPDSPNDRVTVLSNALQRGQSQGLNAIAGIPQQRQVQVRENPQPEEDNDIMSEKEEIDEWYSSAASLQFPHSSASEDLSDVESDVGATRLPPSKALKMLNEDDEPAKMVEINNFSMLCSICSAIVWVFGSASVLLALTWHYVWVEVEQLAEKSAKAAVEHGCLHATEVLRGALVLVRTLDLGFRMGTIVSMWANATNATSYNSTFDYVGYKRVVEPFFKVLPELKEVEVVDTPASPIGVAPGSILAARSRVGGVEIRSDRGDCDAVPGRRGCTLEPQLANTSSWYDECSSLFPPTWSSKPIQAVWTGPEFSRDLPHEAICDELCWSPTYSLTAKVSGHIDPRVAATSGSEVFNYARSVVARVTLEATVFVNILKTVQVQSRGEAVICNVDGTVVAAVDMSRAQMADAASGVVTMVKIWDFPRDWSAAINAELVRTASGSTVTNAGYLVSAWKLVSPFQQNVTGVMDSLGDKLRLVVAIHQDAFADTMIHSLRFWFIVVSALPVAFVVVMVIVNLFSRLCLANKMKPPDVTFEEMQRMARSRTVARITKTSKAWTPEGSKPRFSRAWTMQGSKASRKSNISHKSKSMGWLKTRSAGNRTTDFNVKSSLPSTFSGRSTPFSSKTPSSKPSVTQAIADMPKAR